MAQSPGEHERFRTIYDANHAAIRDYCFRRLSPDDANDATAEVFLVVWRKVDTVPTDDTALRFLYGIARNTVANASRSTRRRSRLHAKLSVHHDDSVPGHEPQVVQQDSARRILGVLDQLKPTDQEILRLKAWEDLSNADIAKVMGLSVRAVETRLSRARKELGRRAEALSFSESRAVPRSANERGVR